MNIQTLFIRVILGFLFALALCLATSIGLLHLGIDPAVNIVINIFITGISLVSLNLMGFVLKKDLPEHPLLFINTNFFIFLTVFVVLSIVTNTSLDLALSMTLGYLLLSILQNMKTNLLTSKLVSGVFIIGSFAVVNSGLSFFLQSFVVIALLNLLLAFFGTRLLTITE